MYGVPVGHPHWVADQLDQPDTILDTLLAFLPMLHPQSGFHLLRLCAHPRLNHLIRNLPPDQMKQRAARHDAQIMSALARILGEGDLCDRMTSQAQLPLSLGGSGLRSQALVSGAAYSGSWAACARALADLAPAIGDAIVSRLAKAASASMPYPTDSPCAPSGHFDWFCPLHNACSNLERAAQAFHERAQPPTGPLDQYAQGALCMLKEVNRSQPTAALYSNVDCDALAEELAAIASCTTYVEWKAIDHKVDESKLPLVVPPALMLHARAGKHQCMYTRVLEQLQFLDFFAALPTTFRHAFMSMGGPGASCWLTVVHDNRRPWTPAGFQLWMRARLGLEVRQLRAGQLVCDCARAGRHEPVPLTLEHALTCPKGGYVVHRHNAIRDILGAAAVEVGYAAGAPLHAIREVPVSVGSSSQRTTKRLDLELRSYLRGGEGAEHVVGVDITVVHAVAPSNLVGALPCKPGHAIELAAARKRRDFAGYELGRSDYALCPAVWETYGRVGADALQLIRDIGRSPWVTDVWGPREGLSSRRATMQYTLQLLQQCNLEIARRAAEHFILRRVRGALRRMHVDVLA